MALLKAGFLVFLAAAASAVELCDFKRGFDAAPAVNEPSGLGPRRLDGNPLTGETIAAFRPVRRLVSKEIFSPSYYRAPAYINVTKQPGEKSVDGLLLQLKKAPEHPLRTPEDILLSKYFEVVSKSDQMAPYVFLGVNRMPSDLEPQLESSSGYHTKFSIADVMNNFPMKNGNVYPMEGRYRYSPYAWANSVKYKTVVPGQDDNMTRNRFPDVGRSADTNVYDIQPDNINSKGVGFAWPFFGMKPESLDNGNVRPYHQMQAPGTVLENQAFKKEPQRIHKEERRIEVTPPTDPWQGLNEPMSAVSDRVFIPTQTNANYNFPPLRQGSPNSEQVTIKITWTSNSSSIAPPNSRSQYNAPTTNNYGSYNQSQQQPWNTKRPTPGSYQPPTAGSNATGSGQHPMPANSTAPPYRVPPSIHSESVASSTTPWAYPTIKIQCSTEAQATECVSSEPAQVSLKQGNISQAVVSLESPELNEESAFIENESPGHQRMPVNPPQSILDISMKFSNSSDAMYHKGDQGNEDIFKEEGQAPFRPPKLSSVLMSNSLPKEQYIDAFFKSLNVNNPSKGVKGGFIQPSSSKDEEAAWSYRDPATFGKMDNLMSRYAGKSVGGNARPASSLMSRFAGKPIPVYNPIADLDTTTPSFHKGIPINQLLNERKKGMWNGGFGNEKSNSNGGDANPPSFSETGTTETTLIAGEKEETKELFVPGSDVENIAEDLGLQTENKTMVHQAKGRRDSGKIDLFKYHQSNSEVNEGNATIIREAKSMWNPQVEEDSEDLDLDSNTGLEKGHDASYDESIIRRYKRDTDEEDSQNDEKSSMKSKLSPSAMGLLDLGQKLVLTPNKDESTPSVSEISARLEEMSPFDHKLMQYKEKGLLSKPLLQVVHSNPETGRESATVYPLYPVYPVYPINSIVINSTPNPE